MRFHDESYLKDWSENGRFPAIHDDIFQLFAQTHESESVIDLCCCTGLLGQRVHEVLGVKVCGLEGNRRWIERGCKWGIQYPIIELMVKAPTLPQLSDWLKKNDVTGLLARRCVSELFGSEGKINLDLAELFCSTLKGAGVQEIWIEGRANQGRSTHPIPDTETEANCLSFGYSSAERYKNCRYLVATGS